MSPDQIKSVIKTIPNYPKQGIMFRDITSILHNPKAFQSSIDILTNRFKDQGFTKVVGTEARGFLFGAPVALALGISFVPVRKPGKLPREVIAESYELEYGTDTLELHKEDIDSSDKVLLIDDLLATGGTILATANLVRHLGAMVAHAGFVISLPTIGGVKKLSEQGVTPFSICEFEGD